MRKLPTYYPVPLDLMEDPRVLVLLDQLGLEALGMLHFIYTYLAKQPNQTSYLNVIRILAKRMMGASDAKIEAVVTKYNLFVIDDEGAFFSPDLNEWLSPYVLKSDQMRAAALARWQKQAPPELPETTCDSDNYTNAMHVHCMSNAKENRIDKIIKEETNISFDDFWTLYDKKRGCKTKLEKKWRSLTNQEREAAMAYIPSYKAAQPDKLFRKDPNTFLNNKSWNDEIISSQKSGLRPAHEIYAELYGPRKSYRDLLNNLEEGQ